MIDILLVDDHAVMREALAHVLGQCPDLRIVGAAGDGLTAVSDALRLRPDVVLMDVSLPGLDGLEATRRIKAALPQTRVIGLSMHNCPEIVAALGAVGAEGFVHKDAPPAELLDAIHHRLEVADSARWIG